MDHPRLGPFIVHGFAPEGETGDQVYGVCPFCGKSKFYIQVSTGQWDCKAGACGRKGNTYSFLTQVWEVARTQTKLAHYKALAKDRGLSVETLRDRAQLAFDGERWLLPIYNDKGALVQVRHFTLGQPLFNTKGLSTALFGAQWLAEDAEAEVWICEGEWDALAMAEMLEAAGEEAVAVAAPGASVWKNEWTALLAERHCHICYDHDKAGGSGQDKLEVALRKVAEDVEAIHWPEDVPEGYDVRDYHNAGGTLEGLREYFLAAQPLEPPVKKKVRRHLTLEDTLDRYSEWLCLSPEIEAAIRLAFAVAVSNRVQGDPVWLFLVAPPGGCKTEVLMSLHACPECIVKSTLTPHSLVSGFRTPDGADPSLIPQLNGKVFVLKDFTEVQEMNRVARDEVYSVLRGAYDGLVEKNFGNGIVRQYTVHFSMLAGATHHIQADRHTALGERFLMYRMKDATRSATIIRAAMSNVGDEGNMRGKLQEVAAAFLGQDMPVDADLDENGLEQIVALAQLSALLRGEVAKDMRRELILYRPQAEVGTRLAKQLKKLAISLQAIAGGGKIVTPDCLKLVRRVALDTASDFDMEITMAVGRAGAQGLTLHQLSEKLRIPKTTLKEKLEDMELLDILRHEKEPNQAGRGAPTFRFLLSKQVQPLWETVEAIE